MKTLFTQAFQGIFVKISPAHLKIKK